MWHLFGHSVTESGAPDKLIVAATKDEEIIDNSTDVEVPHSGGINRFRAHL